MHRSSAWLLDQIGEARWTQTKIGNV